MSEENDSLENYEGEDGYVEQKISFILEELNEFDRSSNHPPEDLEKMLGQIDDWRKMYEDLSPVEFKQEFFKALLKTEIHISRVFLDIFCSMDYPPKEACKTMNRLIGVLENNLSDAVVTSSPEAREVLDSKIREALMKISSDYPEILEGESE